MSLVSGGNGNPSRTAPKNASHFKNLKAASPSSTRSAPRDVRTPALHHICEDSMSRMTPGDILLLDGAESLRDLVDPAFFAILSCPLCGKLDLITQSQYFGADSVICAYDDCSCHFRIGCGQDLIYLPVN